MHQRLLGVTWTGMGYCNNSSDTPFRFSGSDYKLFMDGFYLDSPNLDDTKYLLEIVSGNKAVIGSIFVTGDGPTPVRVSAGQMVRICNMEMEAEGVPRRTAGAGLFVAGGNVVVENAWFFRTMDNPSSTGRGDNGVIHQTGGVLRVMNASFGEYNNSETHTENHVYSSGGQTYLYAPLPWNLEANSGTGGTTNARALQTAKAGSGQIFLANHTAL
jgi:hypothetical protein